MSYVALGSDTAPLVRKAGNQVDASPPARAHFRETHSTIKLVGEGAFGSVYVAIKNEIVATTCMAYDEHRSLPKLIAELRAAMFVVKFHVRVNTGRGNEDLSREINFLSHPGLSSTAPGAHLITPLLAFHKVDEAQWMTLPYIRGGTLTSFCARHWKNFTISLRWHIVVESIRPFLFLHYGILDLETMAVNPDWPANFHYDVHGGNFLVRPVSESINFPRYPDIVLADFGLAYRAERDDRRVAFHHNVNLVRREYGDLADLLLGIFFAAEFGKADSNCKHCKCHQDGCQGCPHVDCVNCATAAIEMMAPVEEDEDEDEELGMGTMADSTVGDEEKLLYSRILGLKDLPKDEKRLLQDLGELVQEAMKKRQEFFVELEEEITAALEEHEVSEWEILKELDIQKLPEQGSAGRSEDV